MRKITRTRTRNKNRLYYIFGIIAFCTFVSIGIGYSILTSVVRIDGTASITSTWRIVFTDAKEKTMDKATTKAGPTITGETSLSLSVELDEPGSQATYDVTVQNQGTIDAVVKEIRFNDGKPNDLKVVVSNLYKGFPLKAGESKTFQVIATWDPSVPESSETEEDIKIDVDFEQETNDSQKPVLSMPTYTVDYPNEVWTKEKNVTMKYPTGEGLIYQYSTDGGKSWKIAPASTYVLKFTNDGTLYIRVSDGKSVSTTPLILIERIDSVVPSVSISGNDSNWTASKTLTIQATDKESGLASNPYSWDGGSSWTSEKSKTYTSNQTVNIWVKDNAGNVNKQTVTINKIDDSAPTNVTVKESGVTSSSITVTASATQSGAGIKGYQFSINNGAWTSEQTSVTKTFTGLTKNTSYQVKVRAIAHNGKYTDSSNITVKTNDISVPTYDVVDGGPNLTKEVTINYGGTKTSNLVYEYSLDGGSSWKTVSGTSQKLTFTENGTVIARVRDTGNTNNTVTASTLTIQFPINMLKSDLRLGSLTSIEFVNDIAPEGTEYIDVSKEQNGSIQLWTDTNGKSYIGSKKKIYGNTYSSYLFSVSSGTNTLETIEFNDYFDTSQVKSMMSMFKNARKLTNLDISNWDTSQVTDMGSMFWRASSLISIGDLSSWDTSNVIYMDYMFSEVTSLTGIGDISNWDISKVTNMSWMFGGAESLTGIGDLSNWDTSKVTDMGYMFNRAYKLTSIGDISNWDTSKVTDMSGTFNNTDSLTSLDISSWDTSNVTNMSDMFGGTNLTSLDLSGWDTSQVTNMSDMFSFATSLTNIGNLSNWDTSKVTNMSHMFSNAESLTSLDLSTWDTSNVTNMSVMFAGTNLTSIGDLSTWDTSQVTDMISMFNSASILTNLDLSNWDTSNVTNISYMFKNSKISNDVSFTISSKMTNYTSFVDGSNFESGTARLRLYDDGTKAGYDLVETMVSEFGSSTITHAGVLKDGITLLNLNQTGWLPSNVAYVQFSDVAPLASDTTVDLSKDNDGTVLGWQRSTTYFVYRIDKEPVVANPNSSWLFGGMADRNLKSINTSGFLNTVNVTNFSNMFAGRMGLTAVDFQQFNTSNATNMSFLFSQDQALTTLNLSNLDLNGVTNVTSMFAGCTNLTTSFTVKGSTITAYTNMFGQNTAQNGKITVYDDGTNSALVDKMVATSTNGKVVHG